MFISVVLPAYNSEAFLRLAVQSVPGQSHREFELLLIDDGSTDSMLFGSADIIRQLKGRLIYPAVRRLRFAEQSH